MLTEERILEIVESQIAATEKLGYQGSRSGHMAHVSYRIDQIRTLPPEKGRMEIEVDYTLLTETEFTGYPDNPPYETPCLTSLIVDTKTGELIT
ncbi:MAG: hypothetical protein JXA23_02610 [Bacteroidales bacterium]|nr:hypothetical protein [Bacteroidales bacterium]